MNIHQISGDGQWEHFSQKGDYNIVDAYNKQEAAKTKKEHRKPA
jgi:hypothetical protein